MAFEQISSMNEALADYIIGGTMGSFMAAFFILAIFIFIGIYIYFALSWSTIARKLKFKKDWLAWIPFANLAMILHLGGFHWALIFLLLIPIFGWLAVLVLLVIATWRIFEKRKYPGWFSLSMIVPKVGFLLYLIAIGFVAWSDKNKR